MKSIVFPAAFRYRRFRYLWVGHIFSVAGRRMQYAIVLWHVNEISKHPIALGGVGLAQLLPLAVMSLVAGAIADVVNRRWLMIGSQLGLALLSMLVALIVIIGYGSLWLIYALIFLSALVGTIDIPARFSLVSNVVAGKDLVNAFSLITIAFHIGNIFGPAITGIMIVKLGIGYTYLVNGVLFIFVILSLFWMGPVHQQSEGGYKQVISMPAVVEGIRFVMRHPLIMPSMLLDFLGTFFASAMVLLPIYASEILRIGSVGYGWLVAARSIGGGVISIILSISRTLHRQGVLLLGSTMIFGLVTILFGLSRSFWLTFLALAIIGAADGVSTVIRQTIRQMRTPDRLRGRMTSVNQIFFQGGPQLGELRAGLTAQWFGAPNAVVSGGLFCVLSVALITACFPQLRRYQGDEL